MAGVFDGEEFGKTIVEAVNASIDRQLAPLLRRLDALEASTVADDMKSVRTDLRSIMETVGAIPVIKDDAIRALITEEVRDIRGALESTLMPEMQVALSVMVKEAVATIPVPVAPELPDISAMVKEAVATIPVPVAPELPDIAAMVDDAVKALPPARDGKDADPIDMEAVKALVVEVVAGVELPELPDVRPLIDDAVSKAVSELPPAKDGKDADPIDMEAVKALVVEVVAGVELPELPDIAGMVKELSDAADLRMETRVKDVFIGYRKSEFHADLDEAVKSAVSAIEIPKAPELPDIAGMVTEAVGKAVSELPPAKDGKDADPVDMDAVKTILIEAVAALPPAKDGKDADPVDMDGIYRRVDEVLATGLDEYKKSVDNIRIPEDGKSVTVDDVRPLIDDAVSKAVAALPPAKDGKDGADVMDAVIDRVGHLVLTFSNGKTKDVGQVVGDDGVDCDFDGVWKLINEKLDSWPKPKDGMGFDDLAVEYDGERTFKFVLSQGDRKKEFAFDVPIVLDRGIYADGKSYARGDAVTWDGSSWIAQTDGAKEKPGTGKEWRLAIKRGTRGKDGVMTVPKAPAPVMLGGR